MTYEEIALSTRQQALELHKSAPETMRAFQGLMKSVSTDGALSAKTKELMAVVVAIVTKCEGCIVFHIQNALKHGASREEVVESICVAIEMGGGPATVYGGKALAIYDSLKTV